MAIAGIDMAVWDALARTRNLSLARLLGSVEEPVRAYGAVIRRPGPRAGASPRTGLREASAASRRRLATRT